MAKSFLRPQQNEVLSKVTVFSVRYPKKSQSSHAQSNYHKRLKKKGVELIYGQYKKKTRLCLNCNEITVRLEEKETDVNIALRMVIDAEDHKYDRAIIVSADTDLVPEMIMVKKRHSEKEIFVAIPPKTKSQRGRSHEMLKIADKVQSLKLTRIKESLL